MENQDKPSLRVVDQMQEPGFDFNAEVTELAEKLGWFRSDTESSDNGGLVALIKPSMDAPFGVALMCIGERNELSAVTFLRESVDEPGERDLAVHGNRCLSIVPMQAGAAFTATKRTLLASLALAGGLKEELKLIRHFGRAQRSPLDFALIRASYWIDEALMIMDPERAPVQAFAIANLD